MSDLSIVKTETPYHFCAGCGAVDTNTIAVYDTSMEVPLLELCRDCAEHVSNELTTVVKNRGDK